VTVVLTLLCHGCPLQAIVAAFGFDERTVAQWQARAGEHCQGVHRPLVEPGQLVAAAPARSAGAVARELGFIKLSPPRGTLLILLPVNLLPCAVLFTLCELLVNQWPYQSIMMNQSKPRAI
jgi:hypothetical protein